MTTFDEREAAYEAKFVHEAELEFMAQAARNKDLAFWAAAKMGKTAEQAVRYAKDLIRADLEEGGDMVLRKLKADLGDLASEELIRETMGQMLAEARKKAKEGNLGSLI